jgi:hypothetical protein
MDLLVEVLALAWQACTKQVTVELEVELIWEPRAVLPAGQDSGSFSPIWSPLQPSLALFGS